METIKGRYNVSDCEHIGDIVNACNYLRGIGCIVDERYWDGKDCGEAYITFSFTSDKFIDIYKRLDGSSVYFDVDINDYLPLKSFNGLKSVSDNEFSMIYHRLEKDISKGFEKRIPICFFFHEKGKKIDKVKFVNDVLTTLGKGTEIVCYRNQVVDGNEYDNFILTTDISNMQKEKFGLIGDSCLGNRDYSLMRRMNLYGECHCIHSLFGSYYDEFRKRVDDVVNERNLIYRERYAKDKEFTFSQYCDKDNGTIITHIDEGRLHYYIKK